MQCFTSCWRLVDWQKDLASRVSSILMELCELEVFLLSWPEPSQSSSPGSSPGKYSSGRSRSCPCHCIGGHFLWTNSYAEFLVTPKFGVLLRIRSNWAKHSEFTPKFGAPRLGHHFCSLNGWKILSRSWDMTKWRCLQKTLSARTNFVQNVVQNYRGHNLILNFQVHLETKVQIF